MSGRGGASHRGRKRGLGWRGVPEGIRTRKSRRCWCRSRSGRGLPRCTHPRLYENVRNTAHLPLCLTSQATPLPNLSPRPPRKPLTPPNAALRLLPPLQAPPLRRFRRGPFQSPFRPSPSLSKPRHSQEASQLRIMRQDRGPKLILPMLPSSPWTAFSCYKPTLSQSMPSLGTDRGKRLRGVQAGSRGHKCRQRSRQC